MSYIWAMTCGYKSGASWLMWEVILIDSWLLHNLLSAARDLSRIRSVINSCLNFQAYVWYYSDGIMKLRWKKVRVLLTMQVSVTGLNWLLCYGHLLSSTPECRGIVNWKINFWGGGKGKSFGLGHQCCHFYGYRAGP